MIGYSKIDFVATSRFSLLLLVLTTLAVSAGCDPASKKQAEETTQEAKPDVSDVPLRIQIVADVSDTDRIKRQWLSFSSQPVDIRAVPMDDFLAAESCEADIVLYPSQLLGELVKRQWVAPLLSSTKTADGDEIVVPAATSSQASFGRTKYGVPLGCSIPAFLGSSSLVAKLDTDGQVSWEQVLASLDEGDGTTITDVDKQATLDRFLAIVATLSDRNPKYGLLFEMQDMKSRLREPEFLEACKILERIAKQPGGEVLAAGSHVAAWSMISGSQSNLFAIGVPTLLDAETAALQGVVPISIERKGALAGWNTGAGLLASISTKCRQTSRANQFVHWLGQASTLDALAGVVVGIDADKAVAGPEASSWQVRQASRSAYSQSSLPREPCLPAAVSYRAALADALAAFLSGQASAEEALEQCHAAWADISGTKRSTLRDAYEKSLGLGI